MALIKGYRNGLIVGVASYLALIIGLAAAMKLSAVVADHLSSSLQVSGKWMPFLAFILVFGLVVFLIRGLSRLVQGFSEKIMLGGLNKLGGMLLYIAVNLTVWGILLFYLGQLGLISEKSMTRSMSYPYVSALGRFGIDGLGKIIPVFKDLFGQLELFFEGVAAQAV
ncbi:hypothetical protein GCM10027051_03890 [Niabella terrae]